MRWIICGLTLLSVAFQTTATEDRNPLIAAKPGTFKLHPKAEYVERTVIFKVTPQWRNLCTNDGIIHGGLQNRIAELGGGSIKKIYPLHKAPVQERNEDGERLIDLSLIYELRYASNVHIEKACNLLLQSGILQYAEPRYMYRTVLVPNDPQAASQAHLSKIKAQQAWDVTQGDTSVVIGVIDSGIDWDHPDMQANVYLNYADPINGLDDDNDGFVDNYRGWDFGGADFNNITPDNNPMVMGANNNHGSHVSGISNGVTNNGIGTAGVSFKCKLLGIKAAADNDTRANGAGFILGGYEGITYGADHGADILNLSWGGQSNGAAYGQDIVDYATINKGVLVVAACGNDASEADFMPAYLDKVLSVASTNNSDGKSGFSNFSLKVGVSAPGSNILAAIYNNGYGTLSGTSMASPVVAGVAALVKSVYPNYTPAQIAAVIKSTADNIYGISANRNFIGKLGSGRVNAFAAVSLANKPSLTLVDKDMDDGNDGIFESGESISFWGVYKNLLSNSSSQLTATVTSLSPTIVSVTSGTVSLGQINAGAQLRQTAPFALTVAQGAALDAFVTLKVQFTDPGTNYSEAVYFNIMVNQTFINVKKNNIKTTIASNGRIGYSGDAATLGLGFLYKDIQTLFEMGTMAATSATNVGDCVRDDNQGYRKTFESTKFVREAVSGIANYSVVNRFRNAPAFTNQPNIVVNQKTYLFNGTPADSNYIIVGYTIINPASTPLSNFHYGIYADYDITTNGANDIVKWDTASRLGYAGSTLPGGHLAGIGLLNRNLPMAFTPITNDGSNGGAFQVYDGFTLAEKYQSLSSGVDSRNTVGAAAGQDVSLVAGYGPLTIPAGDSITLLFALTAGPDLQTLTTAINNANNKTTILALPQGVGTSTLALYPNPTTGLVNLPLFKERTTIAAITDLTGKLVGQYAVEAGQLNLQHLTTGLYTVKVEGKTAKLIITR